MLFIERKPDYLTFVDSWFAETVEVYSPFAMVVLVSSTCDMAIVAFEIDLVINTIEFSLSLIQIHFFFLQIWEKQKNNILANSTCWWCITNHYNRIINKYVHFICLLLLWWIVNRKLSTNVRCFVRIKLVKSPGGHSKILDHYDCKCAKDALLSWF